MEHKPTLSPADGQQTSGGDDAMSQAVGKENSHVARPLGAQRLDRHVVTWDGPDDVCSPLNWTTGQKMLVTILFGFATACSTFASSIFAAATPYVSAEFGVSNEAAILGVSLFLLGYAFGPIVWAPLSELVGRKVILIGSAFVFSCFSASTATATNIQTIMITCFFGAVFAGAPVTIVGGSLADVWDQRQRGSAMVLYAICIVCAPTLALPIGAAICESYLGWRWTEYLSLCLSSVMCITLLLFLRETSHDAILVSKAKTARLRAGNWAAHAQFETVDHTLNAFAKKLVWVPMEMLALDPMVLLVTAYTGFAYGILYLLFSSLEIIFGGIRGWSPVPAALPNWAVLVGCLIGAAVNLLYSSVYYSRYLETHSGKAPPEKRLIPMMLGGVFFPVGFFIVGWTSQPSVHWFPSMVGLALLGASFMLIFQAGLNYLIDVYTKQAVSAVAAGAFQKSAWACGLPLVAHPLFDNLGVPWGSTLLGCLAVLFGFTPFIFFRFGPSRRSRFVPAFPSARG